jgi:splicing factor 3B subunit 2
MKEPVVILNEAVAKCKEYGLDSNGPLIVLQKRIKEHVKDHPKLLQQRLETKKRSKKKKRVEKEDKGEEIEMELDLDIEVEIEEEKPEFEEFKEFEQIFTRFKETTQRGSNLQEDQELQEEDQEEFIDKEHLIQTRKKMRKIGRMTVAQLKQMVPKPEVVEWVDVTSTDPMLLVTLKSTRNTVPVPDHWAMKRKYLQGKRGMEKPPFELPGFLFLIF